MYDITCSIVVYHNPSDELRTAIESFLNNNQSIKLFLVDNSSNDDLRYQFISPQLEYIFNGRNLGYGAAHNLAIKKIIGKSRYHLILNPDVAFNPGILNSLYDFMELNKAVGLVMPKVFYKNGEEQHLCKKIPTPFDLILRRFLPSSVQQLFKKSLEGYELKHMDYNRIMEVPNLSGCFMFIRNDVFTNAGLFDERYFLYLEDTDFCRRINEFYRTVYFPTVSIVHGYSKASYRSFKLMKYHLTSSFKYFNKWGWIKDSRRDAINFSVLSNSYVPRLRKKEETYIQSQNVLAIV